MSIFPQWYFDPCIWGAVRPEVRYYSLGPTVSK